MQLVTFTPVRIFFSSCGPRSLTCLEQRIKAKLLLALGKRYINMPLDFTSKIKSPLCGDSVLVGDKQDTESLWQKLVKVELGSCDCAVLGRPREGEESLKVSL